MFRLLALLVLFISTQAAVAWPFHGDGGASPSLVLANTTNSIGNRTLSAHGGTQLSQGDIYTGASHHAFGTGIYISGPLPAKWSTTLISGTVGHFNLLSHVAEGTSAITPTPTAAGVTAQLNGGPYVFRVDAEDSSNNVIASSTFTYNVKTDDGTGTNCGAVNVGPFDAFNLTITPTGFASTLDGCAIYLSTGFAFAGRAGFGLPYTHLVTISWADGSARMGSLVDFETKSANSTNILIKDLDFVPTTTNVSGATAAYMLGGTNISLDGGHVYSTAAMRALGSYALVNTSSSTGGTVKNFGGEWLSSFFTVSSGYTYQFGWSRWANANAITTGNGYLHDFHVKDLTVLAFKLPDAGAHPDCFQIGDGATPWDYSVERLMCATAGGTDITQGPMFGGSPTGSGNSFTGYVSAGCGNAAAGQTLCVVTGGMQTNGNGAKIYSTAGSPVGLTDGITINCLGTPCVSGAGTQYPLIGLAGNVNLGSAASPVPFYGIQGNNAVWDMIFNSGFVTQGSWTVSTAGISSLTHFSHIHQTTPGITDNGIPTLKFVNCQTNPLWTGTYTVAKGAEFNKWSSDCAVTTNPPVNTTVTNVLNANANTTTLATWYTNGDPQACLEAKSIAQWDALSIQAAMVYAASCAIVKPSGPLDLGSGDVANAIGTSSTPTWADGTVVGTGFAGQ